MDTIFPCRMYWRQYCRFCFLVPLPGRLQFGQWDVSGLEACQDWRSMVKHQPLQVYERQLCLSCLTGIYGCRWKRYQRSHDDTTKVSSAQQTLCLYLNYHNGHGVSMVVISGRSVLAQMSVGWRDRVLLNGTGHFIFLRNSTAGLQCHTASYISLLIKNTWIWCVSGQCMWVVILSDAFPYPTVTPSFKQYL